MPRKITERTLFDVFVEHGDGMSRSEIILKVMEKLSIDKLPEDSKLKVYNAFACFQKKKKNLSKKTSKLVQINAYVQSSNNTNVLFEVPDLPSTSEVSPSPKRKFRKSVDDLKRTQKKRRTDKIWYEVLQASNEQECDITTILALTLTRSDNAEMKRFGKKFLRSLNKTKHV